MCDELVSVVITCRNEVNNIETCLESVYLSNYPRIEVFIVDGISVDGTRNLFPKLLNKYKNLSIIDNVKQTTPFAVNLGVRASRGKYVLLLGARNTLAKDYISLLVEKLIQHADVDCVGGDYIHVADTKISKYIAYAMESKFGVGPSNYRTMKKDCYVDTVGIAMYRRSIFDEIGFFDERLTRNQDDDFNYRVTMHGGKILYVHAAKTEYHVRGSLTKLFRQFSQYGYFKVYVNKKHHTFTTVRQVIPACFVLFLIFGILGSIFSNFVLTIFFSILAIYLVLSIASALFVARKINDVLITSWAMFVMHVAYGFGYLKGIWHFLILRQSPSDQMQKQTT